MRKPKGLSIGDKVALIAPSSPTAKETVDRAKSRIEDLGFNVVMGESCYESYGYLAGSDELRAKDINTMFRDKEIDGIICLRGGYGASRILELLDYEMIKENPKVFVGYSDITVLHIALTQKSDLITYHGPMAASDFAGNISDFSVENFKNIVFDGDYQPILENPDGEEVITIREGRAEGEVIGGNLCLLTNTIGTDYEIDTKDKILFIEEVGEDPYAIDRMLTQLKLSGKFEGVKGILLGDFADCVASKSEYDEQLPLIKVFENILGGLGVPCMYNFQLGHCEPVLTIPFGVKVEMDTKKSRIKMLEKPNL